MSQGSRLHDLIRQHELFWSAWLHDHPSPEGREFLDDVWDPFYQAFTLSFASRPLDTWANELSRIRDLAAYNGITTPDLGTAQHGYVAGRASFVRPPERLYSMTNMARASTSLPLPTTTLVGRSYTDTPPPGQRLVDLTPALAPGAGGMTVKMHMGKDRMLNATVCIDNRCYQASMNLGPVIDKIAHAMQAGHDWLHAHKSDLSDHPDVHTAGQAMVADIADRHPSVYISGWWSDIERDVKKVAHGIERGVSKVASTIGHTLSELKGPIAQAASIAAGAAAGVFLGPEAAPIAAGLANSLVNAVAGTGSVKQAAKQVLSQAQQIAQTNPAMAQALGVAQQMATASTIGHHVAQTVADAAAGNQGAMNQIQALTQAAAGGDPSAQQALSIAQQVTGAVGQAADSGAQAMTSLLSDGGGDGISTGDGTSVSGSAIAQAASKIAAQNSARVVGVVLGNDGQWTSMAFPDSDTADDWLGQAESQPRAFAYAAYFDKADPTWPEPLNDWSAPHAAVKVGVGPLMFTPLELGLAALGALAGGYWWGTPGATPPHVGADGMTDAYRNEAVRAVTADPRGMGVYGIRRGGGRLSLLYFASLDGAAPWWQQVDPTVLDYYAIVQRGSGSDAWIIDERLGSAAQPAVSGFFAPALAALGGFAAGYFGPEAYKWAKAKWETHKEEKEKERILAQTTPTKTSGWFSGLERDVKKAEHAIEKHVPGARQVFDVAEDIEKYTTPEGLTYEAVEALRGGGGKGRKSRHTKPHETHHTAGWFDDIKRDVSKAEHSIEKHVPGARQVFEVAEDIEKYTTPEGLTYDAYEALRGGHGEGRKSRHAEPYRPHRPPTPRRAA
jgi:hypothetical protein